MGDQKQYRVLHDRKLIGQLIIAGWGFLLTGIIGTGLTFLFNRLDWQSRAAFEEKRSTAVSRREEVKSIIGLCQRRFFYSQRLFQLLETQQSDNVAKQPVDLVDRSREATYQTTEMAQRAIDIDETYKAYKQVVDEWNLNLHVNRLLIGKIVNEKAADAFCDSKILLDGNLSGSSVHTKFFLASKTLRINYLAWKSGKPLGKIEEALPKLQEVGKSLNTLYGELISTY